eukprot:scaffold14761_cov75-Phaeocystis_antarctica.AAC.2
MCKGGQVRNHLLWADDDFVLGQLRSEVALTIDAVHVHEHLVAQFSLSLAGIYELNDTGDLEYQVGPSSCDLGPAYCEKDPQTGRVLAVVLR